MSTTPAVHTIEAPAPVDLYVELGAGSLTVTAADDPEVRVELTGSGAEETTVEERDGRLAVLAPRTSGFLGHHREVHARIRVPTGSRLALRSGSAPVTVTGTFAVVSAETGSGALRVEQAGSDALLGAGSGDVTVGAAVGRLEIGVGSGDVRVGSAGGELLVKSGSGDVAVEHVAGDALVRTGSGDVRVAASERRLQVKTGSGRLHVERADGDVTFTSGSGDVRVDRLGTGALTARTASGAVRCAVPHGTPVWTDVTTVSGRIVSGLASLGAPAEGTPYVEVRASTVSGAVELRHV
ncbi:DUF4097 family beta strand repeat protein [Nocardioides sp. ChNu-153]|uniref:DUF4097 family beta strand repeat-containing protein n=1 Tax=Nocardioides sp. ChNu-153 TaxID=2779364 RepID=UPI00264D423A|nr:DUF4097 family beta strand repeat-containing protein [Nocardioides sp. ChNu-153]MDN7120985.1 DUF4097 family beta strand repeat protein [Nocardioides sp. ChNu-153]